MRRKTHAEFAAEIAHRPIEMIDKYVSMHTNIRFKCHAHNVVWVAKPNNVRYGSGCPQCAKDAIGAALRKKNDILEDHGDWVLIDVSTGKWPNATSKMDRDVFDSIPLRISLNADGYPMFRRNGETCTRVHQYINPDWSETDHINRDRTDNRRCNLRECTRCENMQNCGIPSNNTSGVLGVSRLKSGMWSAGIARNRHKRHLGRFCTLAEAADARRAAELEYTRGEWGQAHWAEKEEAIGLPADERSKGGAYGSLPRLVRRGQYVQQQQVC